MGGKDKNIGKMWETYIGGKEGKSIVIFIPKMGEIPKGKWGISNGICKTFKKKHEKTCCNILLSNSRVRD